MFCYFIISKCLGTYDKNTNTYPVMEAVYAFAYAIKKWHSELCNETGLCDAMNAADISNLTQFLESVNFTGE